MNSLLHVLWVGQQVPDLSASSFGPFDLLVCASLDSAARARANGPHDALVVQAHAVGGLHSLLHWQALSHALLDAAVVVVLGAEDARDQYGKLMRLGVQDVLPPEAADGETIARVLRLSVERKRLKRAAHKAHATDLATGLPNHAQLLEHMTHLLALREREPAPMALLVLRIEGLSTTEAALGIEAANVLRRKVAVRLRAGLRASDVVASIGDDAFAVLLAWIDVPTDGMRVASKLATSLQQSFNVAGQAQVVAVTAPPPAP